jgi:hypothetical protein
MSNQRLERAGEPIVARLKLKLSGIWNRTRSCQCSQSGLIIGSKFSSTVQKQPAPLNPIECSTSVLASALSFSLPLTLTHFSLRLRGAVLLPAGEENYL